jgi:hypothetical protein
MRWEKGSYARFQWRSGTRYFVSSYYFKAGRTRDRRTKFIWRSDFGPLDGFHEGSMVDRNSIRSCLLEIALMGYKPNG